MPAYCPPVRFLFHAIVAAALLHGTDRSVAEICMAVGRSSVGSFATSFTRAYVDCGFRDPSGNSFRLTQRKGIGLG